MIHRRPPYCLDAMAFPLSVLPLPVLTLQINPVEILANCLRIDYQVSATETDSYISSSQVLLPQDILCPEEVASEGIGHHHVHRREPVQLMFVRASRPPCCEVVCDVRQMQQKGNGVDEEDRPNLGGRSRVVKQMGGDNRAIRVTGKNDFIDTMSFQDDVDLAANLVSGEYRPGDAKADGHQLDSNDADFAVFCCLGIVLAYLAQPWDVRIQTNAYAMYEEDGKTRLGGMWAVPVA